MTVRDDIIAEAIDFREKQNAELDRLIAAFVDGMIQIIKDGADAETVAAFKDNYKRDSANAIRRMAKLDPPVEG